MADTTEDGIGTRDLEKGLRAQPAATFRTVAAIAVIILLLFNSGGLARWTERLPSNAATAWLAGRAADWHGLMLQLGTAAAFERVRQVLKVD